MSKPMDEGASWSPMSADLSLSGNHVDVWQSPTEVGAATRDWLAGFLSDEERTRMDALRIAAKRNESVVARGLVRYVLGSVLRTDPRKLDFVTGPRGKPRLAEMWAESGGGGVSFNVSHTQGKVLVATALNREVGVDIERIRPDIAAEELAGRFFAPGECTAIRGLPEADRTEAFFRCWTRKEAVLKATGEGMALGLSSFEVSVGHASSPAILAATDPALAAKWRLHDLDVGSGYVACVAVAGGGAEIRRWVVSGPTSEVE